MLMASVLLGASASAAAAPRGDDVVIVPPQLVPRATGGPYRLYLNRCATGCVVRDGSNDAASDSSTIPEGDRTLSPFGLGDAAWDEVVACVAATYAPYDVEVVTAAPSGGSYVEIMVAGTSGEFGLDATTLGIAPLTSDCSAQAGVLGFAFANSHAGGNLEDICATAAHEAGHVYGLDHAYDCKDPMTYLTGCDTKRFLNLDLACGEFDGPRACKCRGASQDSHAVLTGVLGVGALPAASPISITDPSAGEVVPAGTVVFVATAEARRLIRVELWANGRRVDEAAPPVNETLTELRVPAGSSDGVLDLEVRAVSDLGQIATATVRVTQGIGCDVLDACAADEACDAAGRCVAPSGTAAIGAACADDATCASQRCESTLGVCTAACVVAVDDQCPADFTCYPVDEPVIDRACWPNDAIPEDGGGCCDAGGDPATALLLAPALAALLRRRRRRATAVR